MEDNLSEGEAHPLELIEISPSQDDVVCKLCFLPAQAEDGGVKLGPLYQYGLCCAHHYCLMFSSGLDQNGEDEEGIKGFLPDDIVKEWRRGSMLKCFYCKNKYATVGCINSGCRKCYHLPCGLKNGSMQRFFGNFGSYCPDHRPHQTPLILNTGTNESFSNLEESCGICLEELVEKPANDVLWAPCCGGWFHRNCVETMASTAGCHFFKCPLCNNTTEFTEEMIQFGIYVPDQDAQWETDENAFNELLQRHDNCDSVECICPGGRKYDVDDTVWEIILCCCCGSQGIHIECGQLDFDRPRWRCSFCQTVVQNLPSKPVPVFTRVLVGGSRRATAIKSSNPALTPGSRGSTGVDPAGNLAMSHGLDAKSVGTLLDRLVFKVEPGRKPLSSLNREFVNVNRIQVSLGSAKLLIDPVPPLKHLLPAPVKVHKLEEDEKRTIPCPYDSCFKYLSKTEFPSHIQQHKKCTVPTDPASSQSSTEQKDVPTLHDSNETASPPKVVGPSETSSMYIASPVSSPTKAVMITTASPVSSPRKSERYLASPARVAEVSERYSVHPSSPPLQLVRKRDHSEMSDKRLELKTSLLQPPPKRKILNDSSSCEEPSLKTKSSAAASKTPSLKPPPASKGRKSAPTSAQQPSILSFFKAVGGITGQEKQKGNVLATGKKMEASVDLKQISGSDRNSNSLTDTMEVSSCSSSCTTNTDTVNVSSCSSISETLTDAREDSGSVTNETLSSTVNVSSCSSTSESTSPRKSPRKGKFSCSSDADSDKSCRGWIVCGKCGKEFSDTASLDRHERVHLATSFVCQYCRMSFSNIITWKQHENSHVTANQFKCAICGKAFASRPKLDAHENSAHTGEALGDTRITADKDVKKGGREEGHQCEECDFSSNTLRGINTHIGKVHKVLVSDDEDDTATTDTATTFSCDHCKFFTLYKSNFSKHMKTQHPEQLTARCNFCTDRFISQMALTFHIARFHKDEEASQVESEEEKERSEEVECDQCDYTAVNKFSLRSHKGKRHPQVSNSDAGKISDADGASGDEEEVGSGEIPKRKKKGEKKLKLEKLLQDWE